MRTITATVNASVFGGYATPEELISQDPEQSISRINLQADVPDGWVKVGTATVTVELLSDADQLTNQLAMLEEAERRVKADAQAKLNEIEGQRQRLLAIEYKP